jgi:AraC-like DNA-binding protein
VTRQLSDPTRGDAIDSLLRELRVSSTLFCRSKFRAPWGFGVHAHGLASFHVVTSGGCWLQVDGDPEARFLRAGDLAVLPRGETHWLRDDPLSPTLWLEDLLVQDPVDDDLRLTSGGEGASTDLLCGAFSVAGSTHHPVLAHLPNVISVRGDGERPLPWLAATIELVSTELHSPGDGGAAVLERISEVLLGQALRATLLNLRGDESLSLEALYDRGIAPAVRAIHEHPEYAWRVGELASLTAMSRSAFAARFRALTGDSPIRYVARCRLARAARELRTSEGTLGEVARRAGYESVFSFSRAFKRSFGVPPRSYRAHRSTAEVEALASTRSTRSI